MKKLLLVFLCTAGALHAAKPQYQTPRMPMNPYRNLEMAEEMQHPSKRVHRARNTYIVQVDNDTPHRVTVNLLFSNGMRKTFQLAPNREKGDEVRFAVPRGVVLKKGFVSAPEVVKNATIGKKAASSKGRKLDLEVKLDRKGNLVFKKD